MLPLLASARVCILTSVAGTYFVKLGKREQRTSWARCTRADRHRRAVGGLIARAINRLSASGSTRRWTMTGARSSRAWSCSYCALVGLASPALIVWITEYYTSTEYRRCAAIAQARPPATAPT
jgi:K(+)-stimulated pyrophosphate-energized sodium pump